MNYNVTQCNEMKCNAMQWNVISVGASVQLQIQLGENAYRILDIDSL
jgi:hypothetical protein